MVIVVFLAGWITTISGVAMGGWLVYRTKREPYEGLFTGDKPGDAFNIPDEFEHAQEMVATKIPEAVEKANSSFIDQFAQAMTEKPNA
ncbi:hypothetical protein [Desulfobacter postgatei]|uniref:hypothetical protein n=1 Tax=Desulfobacter postgatei TaxID=2293 RepID=UPI00259B7AFE|nr:hypothetical protein [uncultured Desulfobacter sp.]